MPVPTCSQNVARQINACLVRTWPPSITAAGVAAPAAAPLHRILGHEETGQNEDTSAMRPRIVFRLPYVNVRK
jgi:hypothetical protein